MSTIARAIWSGAISFGMIGVPVKLYSATEEKDISFNLLHRGCGERIKQQRWCSFHERVIEWADISKGYEYAKGEYIELTETDFNSLPIPSKETVKLESFVPLAEVDPINFQKSYYLGPGKGGDTAFTLLQRALEEKQLAGVARIAIRNKEVPCLVRANNGTLILDTLFYPDEIREPENTVAGEVALDAKELQLTEELISLLAGHWDPTVFKDTYREQLQAVIDHKLTGVDLPTVEPIRTAAAVNLQAMLAEEIAKVKRQKGLAA